MKAKAPTHVSFALYFLCYLRESVCCRQRGLLHFYLKLLAFSHKTQAMLCTFIKHHESLWTHDAHEMVVLSSTVWVSTVWVCLLIKHNGPIKILDVQGRLLLFFFFFFLNTLNPRRSTKYGVQSFRKSRAKIEKLVARSCASHVVMSYAENVGTSYARHVVSSCTRHVAPSCTRHVDPSCRRHVHI